MPLFAAALEPPAWAAGPFAVLLVLIAVLPLAAGAWWHDHHAKTAFGQHRAKAVVSALVAGPVAVFLMTRPGGTVALWHSVEEYVSFIVLLTALYVISGGVAVRGDLRATPGTNALFLAGGAVLANLIGTTGASMVLIRPVLRTNAERKRTGHIPVFFILVVSNCGGLLTPLGDPPLFLGFLQGVDFLWTLTLWRPWLVVNGALLAAFYVWDARQYRRESPEDRERDATRTHQLRIDGWKLNGPLMLGVIAAVLAKKYVPVFPACEAVMAGLAAVSWWKTPGPLRAANRFTWGPVVEVAVLFAGIFVAMVPALALLNTHGDKAGVDRAWQFFWLTGLLSSGLDNAPTYLAMGTLAVKSGNCDGFADLAACRPDLLAAVSCGAVFMGALSYIGNGPNFMVKAIAEESGYKMPSFFGYVAVAAGVLLPVFGVVTVVFFL